MDKAAQDNVQERLEAGRSAVRQAFASESIIKIHPFDLFTLLKNPMTFDVVVINMFDNQFLVIDGGVYECTSLVPNKTKLREIMAAPIDTV